MVVSPEQVVARILFDQNSSQTQSDFKNIAHGQVALVDFSAMLRAECEAMLQAIIEVN